MSGPRSSSQPTRPTTTTRAARPPRISNRVLIIMKVRKRAAGAGLSAPRAAGGAPEARGKLERVAGANAVGGGPAGGADLGRGQEVVAGDVVLLVEDVAAPQAQAPGPVLRLDRQVGVGQPVGGHGVFRAQERRGLVAV